MRMTKLGRAAIVVLGAGGLTMGAPGVTTATPAEPAARCLSGVYRVQVQPLRSLYTVKSAWIPFTVTCPKGQVTTPPA
ncbi:hypothetical protein QRX60_47480 [Amycolatopsis mongoliensis]|uniref:Secreted protein n=1 Tax=Amycolatopsis mongoliensis TaxID=715475 RepID=A0A9Y2JMY6_9PSEU|nr:hypothetical protein [Amycolatopsis sp. 4-36]WIY01586.1 hypothetical protein QRX60_47480 [Amycolatopsis sp. 4-36]